MQYIRNVINYYDLKQLEWPAVVCVSGLTVTSAVIYGENYIRIPSFIENDTLLVGLAGTAIATGITWFAGTDLGKGLGWILSGLAMTSSRWNNKRTSFISKRHNK